MVRVIYEVVGQDDYMLRIQVDPAGEYFVDSGTYTSQTPRHGVLSDSQREALQRAVQNFTEPRAHPIPPDTEGFEARLTLGEEEHARTYRFWEGSLREEPSLEALVRALEMI